MFWPLRPVDGITKPPPGAVIDLTHPLAPSSCYLFNEGAGTLFTDAAQQVTAGSAALNGGPAWTGALAGGYGPVLSFNGTAQSFSPVLDAVLLNTQLPRNIPLPSRGNRPFTLGFHVRPLTGANRGLYQEFTSGDANSLVGVSISSGTVFFQVRNSAATLQQVAAASTASNGRWHTLHCVSGGDGQKLTAYNDGLQIGAATSNTLGTGLFTERSFLGQSSGAQFNGDVGYFMIWPRALTAAEVFAHAAEPFQMFLGQRPLQPTLLPATAVIDRRTGNFRAASRSARGSL